MAFEFSKLKAAPKGQRLTDPIALFQSLRVTDPSINDLWLAQGDALREWNQNRTKPDISISLNTGAGKTLVGLLIGQSLVNEMRSLVLYACSSIQLVEQTAKKAKGYGLPITTYTKGKFDNDLAAKGEAVCLTTYQALFNGKSIFSNREIAGVVFDDSHAAEHLLRDHFSLRIEKERFASLYSQICSEFSDYFHSVGLSSSFDEIVDGSSNRLLMIPPFEVKRAHAAIAKWLRESTIPTDDNTTFVWAHLKDRTDLCAFIVSSSEITITPAFVPSRTLPYFSAAVRRVYLSATLSALDVFVRTFGREPSIQIAPKTTAGECERMILIPEKMSDVSDDVGTTIRLIGPQKTLLLVPSYGRAEKWQEIAKPPEKERATQAIEGFKTKVGAYKLLLVGRYDGMDLPGDMCRVVVIDDLPSGIGLLERYLWEYLRFSAALRSTIASRIVQSFGRISRGMSDHGVAIVTGRRLVEWLQVPKNLASLPLFLQKQLQLGFQMSAGMTVDDASSAINACLNRERDWVEAYERFMHEASSDEALAEPVTLAELALAEAKYAANLWHRDYSKAASHLQRKLEDARNFSVSTVSWHKLWLGYALDLAGDNETARALYQQAHAGQRNIPPPRSEGISAATQQLPAQAIAAARQFEVTPDGRIRIPRTLERDLLHLDGTGTTRQTEESLRCLGQYLGFEATRPDNEHDTGPDVLWVFADKSALCMDAKTDKEATSVYRKDELGQLGDHVQWVRDNTDVERITPAFIGPEVPASESANPAVGVKVANLANFHAIGEDLKVAYRDIAASSLPLTLAQVVSEEFAKRKLLWPHLELSFKFLDLRDLDGH